MKSTWLKRHAAPPAPHLSLCLSQKEFDAALKHLGYEWTMPYINSGANATTHHMQNAEGTQASLVCIDRGHDRLGVEIAALLVHEAVHVWQQYRDSIGEQSPGREQEAYAIQYISQTLMAEYARRLS